MLQPPRRSIAHESLGFTRWMRVGLAIVGIAIASSIVPRMMSLQGQRGMLALFGSIALAIYVFAILPSTLRRRSRLSRLESLDLPLDRAAYLQALDGAAPRARFVVEMQTKTYIDPAELTVPAGTTVAPHPTSLTISSPAMETRRNGGGWEYYYNGSLHDWFMDVSERALVPLHRRHPISGMTVRFVAETTK